LVRVAGEVRGQIVEHFAGLVTQSDGVGVEEDLVGEMDVQLARGNARHFHPRDLAELLLLLVHIVTGLGAEGGAGGRSDDRTGAGIAGLIAEDRADDRPGYGTDLRAA